ncbi:MAG: aconitate hydratase [Bacillota bacterium]|jgi:aconitate hydratase
MGKNLAQKIISNHLVAGTMSVGKEIALKIDQTLTQDATGTMAYLQFEAIGIPKVKTELSVSYVDHNTLQSGFENADDHRFLRTVASKYGVYFSRPGNGICHQVHLERFGQPGKTLLGSDSHTPTGGGIAMLAIGAGGLDVAAAMAGMPFYLNMPAVVNIRLSGRRKPWVSAKDIILEVLRRLSVKGGVGKIMEYSGDGVADLSVPERATITNMGAELGATSSIFPSDEHTRLFMKSQGREKYWIPLEADADAEYDSVIDIDLSTLEPMAAKPHSPDAVDTVRNIGPIKVDQVAIGSCTNASYTDLMRVAAILKGKKVHPGTDLVISPGSRQVLEMLARNGALADMVSAGARILETTCGPCIGMGQAPSSGSVSVRTFNRNFKGRSGTADAQVYLTGPETAAATAIFGVLTDPRDLGDFIEIELPENFITDDEMILPPSKEPDTVEVLRGPNIKTLPVRKELPETLSGSTLLKLGDNITTDDIMPAGAKILPLRSNIPAISKFVFSNIDPSFPERALQKGGGFIVGGHNYGQGSSREHAALAPMYLGIKAIIAKSFARIHRANLINFGILPLTFADETDWEQIDSGDELVIKNAPVNLAGDKLVIENVTKNNTFQVKHGLSKRQIDIVLSGGLLNYIRTNVK